MSLQAQSHQQETASAVPDGQLRAAHQATDETQRDRGCGCKGQSSHAGERKREKSLKYMKDVHAGGW